jgi:hypothetical protein
MGSLCPGRSFKAFRHWPKGLSLRSSFKKRQSKADSMAGKAGSPAGRTASPSRGNISSSSTALATPSSTRAWKGAFRIASASSGCCASSSSDPGNLIRTSSPYLERMQRQPSSLASPASLDTPSPLPIPPLCSHHCQSSSMLRAARPGIWGGISGIFRPPPPSQSPYIQPVAPASCAASALDSHMQKIAELANRVLCIYNEPAGGRAGQRLRQGR